VQGWLCVDNPQALDRLLAKSNGRFAILAGINEEQMGDSCLLWHFPPFLSEKIGAGVF
jgi:hypothetical protein